MNIIELTKTGSAKICMMLVYQKKMGIHYLIQIWIIDN